MTDEQCAEVAAASRLREAYGCNPRLVVESGRAPGAAEWKGDAWHAHPQDVRDLMTWADRQAPLWR